MAHKFRGEVQVESGLGLPRLTTVQRLAYTPPADGYVVFDTDLKRICLWDATALLWIISAIAAEVDEKIDVLNGIGKNTLTLQDLSDVEVIKLTASETIVAPALDGSNTLSSTNNVDFIVDTTFASGSSNQDAGAVGPVMPPNTGGYYWETTPDGGSEHFAGIIAAGGEALGNTFAGGGAGQTVAHSNSGTVFSGGPDASIGAHNQFGDILRHRYDSDNGTYEMAVNNGSFVAVQVQSSSVDNYPVVGAADSSSTTGLFTAASQTYSAPSGFSAFPGASTGGGLQQFSSGGSVVADIAASSTSFDLEFEGGSNLQLQSTYTQTNNPIHGIDGTDPSSLVTKAYVDGFVINGVYEEDFVIGDWTTGSTNTLVIDQATHGIPHTLGESYTILVQELDNGSLQNVSIEAEVDNTSGDVTISTVGATFNGRIFIS